MGLLAIWYSNVFGGQTVAVLPCTILTMKPHGKLWPPSAGLGDRPSDLFRGRIGAFTAVHDLDDGWAAASVPAGGGRVDDGGAAVDGAAKKRRLRRVPPNQRGPGSR
jgi:hypothetical protein